MGRGRLDSYYLRALRYRGRAREKNRNTVPSLQRKLGEWTEIADPHHRSSGSSAQKSKLVSVLWTYSLQSPVPLPCGEVGRGRRPPCFRPPPPGPPPPLQASLRRWFLSPFLPHRGWLASQWDGE